MDGPTNRPSIIEAAVCFMGDGSGDARQREMSASYHRSALPYPSSPARKKRRSGR